MRRLVPLLVVLGMLGPPAMATSFYESPDVPTDLSFVTYLPWDVVRNDSGAYTLETSFPQNTPVDALHRLCDGNWLMSVDVPTELSFVDRETRDVVHFDGGSFSPFFCGGPIGIPAGSVVDAAYLDGDDLVVSFDVPTDLAAIGGAEYEPADLVRFTPTGAACSDWSLAGLDFDASAIATPVPAYANVTGADERGTSIVVTFDVPTTVGGSTFLPGELASWNGAAWALFHGSPTWPVSSRVNALSMLPDPGSVPAEAPDWLLVDKAPGFPPDILLTWGPSTSVGATDYGIYEGSIGTWYSHTLKVCTDAGDDLMEVVTPQPSSAYYLVVPFNMNDEGSYGVDSAGVERPVGNATCVPTQALGCP